MFIRWKWASMLLKYVTILGFFLLTWVGQRLYHDFISPKWAVDHSCGYGDARHSDVSCHVGFHEMQPMWRWPVAVNFQHCYEVLSLLLKSDDAGGNWVENGKSRLSEVWKSICSVCNHADGPRICGSALLKVKNIGELVLARKCLKWIWPQNKHQRLQMTLMR